MNIKIIVHVFVYRAVSLCITTRSYSCIDNLYVFTFLGSGDIPKHLQKFASPWTPRSRKVKSTKNRNKVSRKQKTMDRQSCHLHGTTSAGLGVVVVD